MDRGGTILLFLAFIQGTCGQEVTLSVAPVVERGTNTVFTCTGGTAPYAFGWTDLSGDRPVFIYTAGEKSQDPKYSDFTITISESGETSFMTIVNTRIEDEGQYSCSEGTVSSETVEFKVEVRYTLSLSVESTVDNNIDMYEATCDALNGRPEVNITWMLGNSGSPCDGTPVETDPTPSPADPDLSSKRSVCRYQATRENYEETLRCIISGQQVDGLNGEETLILNIHSAPSNGTIEVGFQPPDPYLRVSCDIVEGAVQPNPRMRNYYIYSNGTLIYSNTTGVNFVDVPESEFDIYTQFYCEAGNYLGNTRSQPATYTPERPTTPSPTTDMMTSPGPNDGNETGGLSAAAALSIGEIIGIVIGAILGVIIIVLVIYFVCIRGKDGFSLQGLFTSCNCCLRCCNCCLPSDGGNPAPRKHPSAVGTSNGSEKNDVELAAPLNHGVNEVLTEDKIKPVAAPRDQGSIQHTTDNPGQAEYAMVDRKKPGGGDMPDTRGSGQKEPQGMLYADLDLSASAGHTEKKVPQNKDDVVVYSSILV